MTGGEFIFLAAIYLICTIVAYTLHFIFVILKFIYDKINAAFNYLKNYVGRLKKNDGRALSETNDGDDAKPDDYYT